MRYLYRSFIAALAVVVLGGGLLAGCGGDGDQDVTRDMNMVTVNWIEGMALTYVQEQILEDSLDMNVEVNEVQGGGIAFSSVASGNADFFNEAWLPTTHPQPWKENIDQLQKLDYMYYGTSAGIAVPTYMEVDTVPDLSNYQQELDGTINGIESGANINDQIRETLELYNMEDEFDVAAASGPATWQALENAVSNQEPIAVAAWYPHWKWSEFDLKYIGGAQTGHNVDIWGYPEDIFMIVGNNFIDRYPREVVCFLKEFEVNDDQLLSLMQVFNNRGEMSKEEAAQQWIENHPEHVQQWMENAQECAASDRELEYLPDDAAYSTEQAKQENAE